MGRASKTQQLNIWMNGELVGHWESNAQGRHQFQYADSWLCSPSARPISLSMPLQASDLKYRDDRVLNFFENLLPDSLDIRRRLQRQFGARSTQAFDMLQEIGRDCVGAIQLLPPDVPSEDTRTINATPLDEAAIARLLRSTVNPGVPGQNSEDDFRISLAGAQEKTALLWHDNSWHLPKAATPTTHIFKLPLGLVGNMQADLSSSVENEWLCAQIVRAYGIPVASGEMAQFEDQKVLIVERFDRKLSKDKCWWIRLPQEDLCQATGTPVDGKYERDGGPGIKSIMNLLLGSQNALTDRKLFLKTQVLFWLLAAPDGHAKNFSIFIEPQGRYRLTPLYDILSAYPILGGSANQIAPQKLRLAMAALGKNRHYRWSNIHRRHWIDTAKACGLSSDIATEVLQELISTTPDVIRTVEEKLPDTFPAQLADQILRGLRKQVDKLAI